MKKKIAKLLACENATMKINDIMSLHHWVITPESACLCDSNEYLELIVGEGRYRWTERIETGSASAVYEAIKRVAPVLLERYTEQLIRHLNGGHIDGRLHDHTTGEVTCL